VCVRVCEKLCDTKKNVQRQCGPRNLIEHSLCEQRHIEYLDFFVHTLNAF